MMNIKLVLIYEMSFLQSNILVSLLSYLFKLKKYIYIEKFERNIFTNYLLFLSDKVLINKLFLKQLYALA